jgi:hypothetical protein
MCCLLSENGHFYGNGDRPAMIFGSPIQAVVCHAAMRMPLSHRPGTLHGLDHALPGHADVSEIFFNGLPFAPERSNHRLLTWEDPLGASADLAKSFLSYLTSPRITRYKSTYNIVQYRTISYNNDWI